MTDDVVCPLPCLSPAAERLLRLDKEWVGIPNHVDLPVGGLVQQIVAFNPYRIALTIANNIPGAFLKVSQIPGFLGGLILPGITLDNGAVLPQYSDILDYNIESHKTLCTGAWFAKGLNDGSTPCIYITEVVYRGYYKAGCKYIRRDKLCVSEGEGK